MICAKNYETVCKFINIMPRILWLFSGHSVVVAAAVVLAAVVGQYYHPRCAVCSVFKVTRTEPLPIITKYKYNFT